MGKLHQFGNVIVRIYPNDHLPPHFHVVAPDFDAAIEIATLKIMIGAVPAKHRVGIMEWASRNRAAIAAEWNKLHPRFRIGD